MISARWRIRRAICIETALLDTEMVTEEPKVKAKFAGYDNGMVLSAAFRALADESHSMTLLNRYESRLRLFRSRRERKIFNAARLQAVLEV